MRNLTSTIVTPAAILLLASSQINAFSIGTPATKTSGTKQSIQSFALRHHINDNNDSSIISTKNNKSHHRRLGKVIKKKARSFGQLLHERSDTLRSAGFYDEVKEGEEYYPPLEAGFKTNFLLFCAAFGYKWYRSVFINKMAVWERQPQWNTVITSKEMEDKANLEAMTCNNCGSILFIAKGRKWFQMPSGYECYACGAKGEENFTNNREDLLEEIEDDYFDYEKPLDFISAAERRQLMKEAGGDEAMATQLLTQQGAAATESEAGVEDGEPKKKKKKKKGKKKKKKKAVEASAEEISEDDKPEEKKEVKDDLDDLMS